jgi:hypothetical protein
VPVDQELQRAGAITKALLAALDQVHAGITESLKGPDGQPSNTALYMHMPVGHPIDPAMYSYPWTPAGGSTAATVSTTGQFVPTQPDPGTQLPGTTPAAQIAALPASPDPKLQHAIQSAFHTSRLVDDMLMITRDNVAVAWPDRTISIEYQAALAGMQAEAVDPPPADVQARIDAAKKVLYTFDDQGNMTGYSAKNAAYRHNRKAWTDAVAKYATAYAAAMADPVLGQAFPVTSGTLQNDIRSAWNDIYGMGGKEVEDANATLQSIGGSAAAALIAQARQLMSDYSVGLAGAIATRVPWSYIDPISWWDHTNNDFGVQHIKTSSATWDGSGSSEQSSFGNSFYHNSASSTGGGVGVNLGLFSFGANASHSETDSAWGSHAEQSSYDQSQDSSTAATVEFDWFVATIERPWYLGDLFHMDGWYLVGKKKGSISDGTIDGQVGQAEDKLLPMVPKAFVVIRNVTITAKGWGSSGERFSHAMQDAQNSTSSESTSYGGSVGYFGIGGSVQHSDSESEGAFGAQADARQGWRFSGNAEDGTLELLGAQIVGWIGQIQPLAPKVDAPEGAEATQEGVLQETAPTG